MVFEHVRLHGNLDLASFFSLSLFFFNFWISWDIVFFRFCKIALPTSYEKRQIAFY